MWSFPIPSSPLWEDRNMASASWSILSVGRLKSKSTGEDRYSVLLEYIHYVLVILTWNYTTFLFCWVFFPTLTYIFNVLLHNDQRLGTHRDLNHRWLLDLKKRQFAVFSLCALTVVRWRGIPPNEELAERILCLVMRCWCPEISCLRVHVQLHSRG